MKSYDEIADAVFAQRDEYVAKQKKKKRAIIAATVPMLLSCVVLITCLGLWQSGVFDGHLSVTDHSPSKGDVPDKHYAEDGQQSATKTAPPTTASTTTATPTTTATAPQTTSTTARPTGDVGHIGGGIVDRPQDPEQPDPSVPTDGKINPPANDGNGFLLDSLDKINFYSAKKVINEKMMTPSGMSCRSPSPVEVLRTNDDYREYPLDTDKIYTISMVTYFTIKLEDEAGFLAQKLGGTGLVEVVVTESDISQLGHLITFRRGDCYYTCLENGGSYFPDTNTKTLEFTSSSYIDGFNTVKNLGQENYRFTVNYEGAKVIGFACEAFGSNPSQYAVDTVTFVENFCVVLYTKHEFTINQLEAYVKSSNDGAV